MQINHIKKRERQEGIALLITLLLMGVLTSIGASLMNITLKQYQFAGLALASEVAFQAANAGMECARYYDFSYAATSPFSVPPDGDGEQTAPTTTPNASIECFGELAEVVVGKDNLPVVNGDGDGAIEHGEEQFFQFNHGSECVEISVYKFHSAAATTTMMVHGVDLRPDTTAIPDNGCPPNGECTVVQSRGYNVTCSDLGSGNPRIVEREYTQVY